jgi:hypothetical protein
LRRFPLVILAAAASTVAAILTTEDIGPDALRLRLLAVAGLGSPLFLTATLLAERARRAAWPRLAPHAAATAVLLAVYLLWPGWSDPVRGLRFAQLMIAALLLVAWLPVAHSGPLAFWHYNRLLLERFLGSGAAAATLWAGLALALAALDKLFGVEVAETGYARLWFVAAFLFSAWFFVAGVPRDLAALQQRRDYQPALRAFAQYLLVPLVSLYLVILTLYLGKVVVTWDWPSGWIGWLVSGVATAGIFTLLLVYPISDDPEQKWIRAFARDFWLAVLPAVVMLWLALYQRVAQYGITEPRYFLLVLSLWLAASALYFRFRRGARMIAIPASLCVLAALSLAGPWGAYSVSAASQLGRLETLLVRHGVVADGRPAGAAPRRPIPSADRREISAVVRYVVTHHGTRRLTAWLPDSARRRIGAPRAPDETTVRAVVATWGVPHADEREPGGNQFRYRAQGPGAPLPLAGYDFLLPVRPAADTARAGSGWDARLAPEGRAVRVLRDGAPLVEIPLDSLLARAAAQARDRRWADLPAAVFRAEARRAGLVASLYASFVEGRRADSGPYATAVAGFVLVGRSR